MQKWTNSFISQKMCKTKLADIKILHPGMSSVKLFLTHMYQNCNRAYTHTHTNKHTKPQAWRHSLNHCAAINIMLLYENRKFNWQFSPGGTVLESRGRAAEVKSSQILIGNTNSPFSSTMVSSASAAKACSLNINTLCTEHAPL